jgi:hypothetical protein
MVFFAGLVVLLVFLSIIMTTLLFIIMLIGSVKTFIVYDCQSMESKFEPIDLTEPEVCRERDHNFEAPVPIRIQVIQGESSRPIKAHNCKISLSKMVSKCGYNSLTYGIRRTVVHQNVALTPGECRYAAKSGTIKTQGRVFNNITIGRRSSFTYFSHGNLDKDGNCVYSEKFISGDETYEYSYEQTTLIIDIYILI